MGQAFSVLAINPGSTSTKIGLFHGSELVFSENVSHDAAVLSEFDSISDQLAFRKETILKALQTHSVNLSTIDAFVGRGGGLVSVEGGVYEINSVLLSDARRGANGVQHPAQLGSQLAEEFSQMAGGKKAYVVNPPDTDEFCDNARMTGIKGIYRASHLHALNLKETAIRHAHELGKAYEECNFIVCHIGGGVSVSAHQRGKMIDGNDIVGGDGPMSPTRTGSVPVTGVIQYLKTHSIDELFQCCMKTGGMVSFLGTSDAKSVAAYAAEGDKASERVWEAMQYQICKEIGQMACVLKGQVDGIVIGGGAAFNKQLIQTIQTSCEWIAPVSVYPGEFELEAMAAGANRVLSGKEEPKIYTGHPVFSGFAEFDN